MDCDLYISSIQAMEWLFANKLVAPGTVFGYDDWYSKPCLQFKASTEVRRVSSEIEQFGGEARAHVEIARKYKVDFACLCGPCVPVSASERTRGFRPYFVVRSIGERVNTGYDLHDAALRGFLQRKCIGGEMV